MSCPIGTRAVVFGMLDAFGGPLSQDLKRVSQDGLDDRELFTCRFGGAGQVNDQGSSDGPGDRA